MIYSAERIKTLAAIAHFALSDEEVEKLRYDLGALHTFAEALQNAPAEAELPDPFFGAVGLDVLREDIPGECLPPERMLSSEHAADAYFTVPRAVED